MAPDLIKGLDSELAQPAQQADIDKVSRARHRQQRLRPLPGLRSHPLRVIRTAAGHVRADHRGIARTRMVRSSVCPAALASQQRLLQPGHRALPATGSQLTKTADAYVIRIELPGVSKDRVDIQGPGRVRLIVVRARRALEFSLQSNGYLPKF